MKYVLFILLLIISQFLGAQNSVLEKPVTVSFVNAKTEAALHIIEQNMGVRFSYNADIFNDKTTTASFNQIPLQQILESILGRNYAYRVKGNYVIIKSTQEITAKNEKFIYTISGYIADKSTGQIIPFATIFDSASLNGTISNEQGYYELNLEQYPADTNLIGISKVNYKDTFITVKPIDNQVLKIELEKLGIEENKPSVDTGRSNLEKSPALAFLTSTKQRWQASNIRNNFNKDWQVSFLPFLGTNGTMSGSITNRLSFNALGGYAGGIKGVEFGGIFNIDRDTSAGAQFAGVYNLTSGPFKGAQFAGVVNNHFSNFAGAQFAGVGNTCSGNFRGFQAAGVINFARRKIYGTQAAGVINFAEYVGGSQLSGVINTAGKVDGTQVAGLVNVAGKVRGTQIGFINVADTVQGLQIGFLSFCRSGVHQAEYSYNDVLQHNFTFRTGTSRLYNILSVGYHPYSNEAYAAGYGLGSKLKISNKSAINFEATGTALYLGLIDDIHSIFRFSIHEELKLFKSVSIVFGPDLNFYYSNGLGAPLPGYKDPISYIKPIRTFEFNQGRKGQAWVGFHVGIGLN